MAQREPPPQFTSPRVSSPREQSSPYGTSSFGGSPYQSSPYQSSQYHNSPYQNSPFQPLPRMRTPSSDMKRIPSPVPLAQRGLSPSPAPRRSPSPGPFPEYQDDIYAGEEFTPEEQQELEAEEAVIRTNMAPPRPASRGFDFTTPIYVLLSTILIAYAIWYRQEKIAVGYCGLGREATQILPPDVPVPDVLLPFVEPQCEPCPAHAYCYEDFVVRCDTDFVAKPHPLSFGGLIPIPPTCEPDGEKVVRVKAVADKVIEELRVRRAKHECGETVEETGERVEPAIKEKALKELINRQRRKTLGQQEFDELWDAAIGEVKNADEVDVSQAATRPGDIPDTYLSSTSLSKLPFSCAVRHAVLSGLERHRRVLGGVIGALLVVLYITRRIRQRRAIRAQVPGLVDVVLERLATQRETCDEEYDDPWLFLPNLRDDVLRGIHQLGQREKIWKFVVPVVEQNANVRTAQRESRAGEVGRAWEWIGPIRGEVVARRKAAGIEKDKEAYGNTDRPIC